MTRTDNDLSNETLLAGVLNYRSVDVPCYDRNCKRQEQICVLSGKIPIPSHLLYYKRIKSLGAAPEQLKRSGKCSEYIYV
jgi:hypothetical protein